VAEGSGDLSPSYMRRVSDSTNDAPGPSEFSVGLGTGSDGSSSGGGVFPGRSSFAADGAPMRGLTDSSWPSEGITEEGEDGGTSGPEMSEAHLGAGLRPHGVPRALFIPGIAAALVNQSLAAWLSAATQLCMREMDLHVAWSLRILLSVPK